MLGLRKVRCVRAFLGEGRYVIDQYVSGCFAYAASPRFQCLRTKTNSTEWSVIMYLINYFKSNVRNAELSNLAEQICLYVY